MVLLIKVKRVSGGRWREKHKRRRWCRRCKKLFETELVGSRICPDCNISPRWKDKKDKVSRML